MNDTPETDPAAEAQDPIAVLQAQLADAEARAATARDAQLRAVAELDNIRRRLERDKDAAVKFANENLLRELTNISDSLELGLKAAESADVKDQAKALIEGKQLTYKQLMALLEKYGVKQIDPTGKPFNPDLHQAMSMVPSDDVPANHVLSVMQKGYTLHDRLLRPATVVVAKAPA
ncbi:MAG TPA: nucleotide exchange factor GrpE [Nevskiaceae bacterium]|nr:nucleotide exchange factor GrpE [Nevskiaceae bacterium]